MCKCEYCGKEFESKNRLYGHYGLCKEKIERFDKIITKDFLYEMFEEKDYCANYIATVVLKNCFPTNVRTSYLINKAKKFGIKTKTMKESALNKDRRKRQMETNLNKFGCVNPSQNKDVQRKKEETFMKHYGIKNIFCDSQFIKQCFKEKYGVESIAYLNRPINQYNNFNSSIHKKVLTILDELGIMYLSDKHINLLKYNDELQKYYNPRPDICIENKKIILEIQGNYWHANPSIYKPNDLIRLYKGYINASKIWENDEIRKKHIESFGYKVYYIWEDEINKDLDGVKCKIQKWLGLNE